MQKMRGTIALLGRESVNGKCGGMQSGTDGVIIAKIFDLSHVVIPERQFRHSLQTKDG